MLGVDQDLPSCLILPSPATGDPVSTTFGTSPMSLWAIADLHLSHARPEPRERYAARWRDHAATIERQWRAAVCPGDLVLLPGDLSMARNHRELQPDLAWLDRLPGTKVLAPGNHDRWWNGVEKIRPMLRKSLLAVGGDAVATHGAVVCGTRGVPQRGRSAGAVRRLCAALALARGLRSVTRHPCCVSFTSHRMVMVPCHDDGVAVGRQLRPSGAKLRLPWAG